MYAATVDLKLLEEISHKLVWLFFLPPDETCVTQVTNGFISGTLNVTGTTLFFYDKPGQASKMAEPIGQDAVILKGRWKIAFVKFCWSASCSFSFAF